MVLLCYLDANLFIVSWGSHSKSLSQLLCYAMSTDPELEKAFSWKQLRSTYLTCGIIITLFNGLCGWNFQVWYFAWIPRVTFQIKRLRTVRSCCTRFVFFPVEFTNTRVYIFLCCKLGFLRSSPCLKQNLTTKDFFSVTRLSGTSVRTLKELHWSKAVIEEQVEWIVKTHLTMINDHFVSKQKKRYNVIYWDIFVGWENIVFGSSGRQIVNPIQRKAITLKSQRKTRLTRCD